MVPRLASQIDSNMNAMIRQSTRENYEEVPVLQKDHRTIRVLLEEK